MQIFQASANAWPVSKVAIVKCPAIGAATGSVAPIVAIVFMPTPMGAIQSVESAFAKPDGKVKCRILLILQRGLYGPISHSAQYT